MEFKVLWSKENNRDDITKVEKLISIGNGYDYKCGYVIRFYKDGKIVEKWWGTRMGLIFVWAEKFRCFEKQIIQLDFNYKII